MKKTPLVTIISGYYNRSNYVRESVKSLLGQTYKNIEIIIFDDCSTDNTYDELLKIQNLDNRIKLIRNQVNLGFTVSIKNVIEKAKGDYIAIHGSGDISCDNRIEKQVKYLESNDHVIVVDSYVEEVKGRPVDNRIYKPSHSINFYKTCLKGNKLTHGAVMYRKNAYIKAGGYRIEFSLAQDFDLWCRMSLIGECYTIPEVLYKRNCYTTGAVTIDPIRSIKQGIYGTIAIKALRMRKDKGVDFIEILGKEGIALYTPNYSTVKMFLHLISNQLLIDNKKSVLELSSLIGYNSKILKIVCFLVKNNFFTKKIFKIGRGMLSS